MTHDPFNPTDIVDDPFETFVPPPQFAKTFEENRADFTEFFRFDRILERCHVSIEIERPTAMTLEAPSILFFGSRFGDPHFRQTWGSVIRHIMEIVLGYVLDKTVVRVPTGIYVTRAARYRQPSKKPKRLPKGSP